MSREVRIVVLALTLVLCICAGTAPAVGNTAIGQLCGGVFQSCQVDQDCDAYCQPCGFPGTCVNLMRHDTAKVCSCH